MSTYISLLRGINVSGQKKIIMTDLKKLYEDLGFDNVQTYIQSGNVVFDYVSNEDYRSIAEKTELAIEKKYNFHVPVVLRKVKDLIKTVENNPFAGEPDLDLSKVAVTFLDSMPSAENLQRLKDVNYPPDRFVIEGLNIYVHCPIGFGNSKLTIKLFENRLQVKATSRNWRTINKLIEMTQ